MKLVLKQFQMRRKIKLGFDGATIYLLLNEIQLLTRSGIRGLCSVLASLLEKD